MSQFLVIVVFHSLPTNLVTYCSPSLKVNCCLMLPSLLMKGALKHQSIV